MTREEKQAELEKYTEIWQKAGRYIDQLRKEINEEENPSDTLEELKAEADSVLLAEPAAASPI